MTTLHLVSHTHWDREWYLTFQQFRIKLVHLLDHLIQLLEHDPNYDHFMLDGQAIILEDYLEVRPELEKSLRRFIETGRLLIGPWYVLPDEFLVSPEALVRNLLIGDRICARFGTKMNIAYNPDTFGHIGQMPQIARGFGFSTASLWRGVGDQPCEFWWQSPDGSRVLMAFLRDSYGNGASLPVQNAERFEEGVLQIYHALSPHCRTSQMLIMHGMDHMEPPAETSQAIAAFNASPASQGMPLKHSTLPAYLEAVEKEIETAGFDLPTVMGELRNCQRAPLLPGVLSARMWIKQRNQTCQTLLEKWTEPFSAWASLLLEGDGATLPSAENQPSLYRLRRPADLLRLAWKMLIQCHPHDSICGCSIDQVHEEMRSRFDQVEQIGEEICQQSLQSLAALTDTSPGSAADIYGAVVVFNPSQMARSDVVPVEVHLPEGVANFVVLDEGGNEMPYQVQGSRSEVLINMSMTPEDLKGSFSMVAEGKIMNWVISNMAVEQRGSEAQIDLVFSEAGAPNHLAIEKAQVKVNQLLAEGQVSRFLVRAVSAASSQATLLAKDVPGMGYRTFWIKGLPAVAKPPEAVKLNPLARSLLPVIKKISAIPIVQKLIAPSARGENIKPPYRIENEHFTVTANEKDGSLTVTDNRQGVAFQGLNRFVDSGDCGDEYNFCPPPQDDVIRSCRLVRVRRETSAIHQALHLSLSMEVPASLSEDRQRRSQQKTQLVIETSITLFQQSQIIAVHTEVENTAKDHRLRVHFPFPFPVDQAAYDGHYEIVRRQIIPTPDGNFPYPDAGWVEQPRGEVPQRHFVDLASNQAGLLIANRGLPEVAVLTPETGSREIALTLLRCVGWLSRDDLATRKGHAGPAYLTPGAQMPGRHAFDYAIIPHLPAQTTAAYHLGYAFATPLRSVTTGLHTGSLPASASLLSITPQEFVITAVKTTEDGSGWLARGVNLSNQPITVTFKPWRRYAKAQRINLAEQPIEALTSEADGSIRVYAQPFQVITVKFSHS